MADTEFPEPDRIEGAPHPRETAQLLGQRAAEAEVLTAFASGRMHHAWLISGPRGVGKATLAWKIARFLLDAPVAPAGLFGAAPPAQSLDTDADSPLARRIRALSEPRLFLLRRTANTAGTALSQVITVDDVRQMRDFFGLSAADGGRRVAIIDAADELNPNAANALLKLLEEPPQGGQFLLISHQAQRLLPTIRSRCRMLRLEPLSPQDLGQAVTAAGAEVASAEQTALAELAAGSVGEAFRLVNLNGLDTYTGLLRIFSGLPRLDRGKALALSESGGARGAEERFDLILRLIDLFLSRLARAAANRETPPEAAEGEAALFARLAPHAGTARIWADLAQSLTQRARQGKAVNLDPAALLMDILLEIDKTAGQLISS